MDPAARDFCSDVVLDNGLLRADIARGEVAPIDETLSLAAAAKAIYLTATLKSRELDRVRDQYSLWSEVSELFTELCDSWANTDSDDPQIQWLLARLRRYRDLALDRVSIYTVSEQQRLRHAKTRDADIGYSFTERHEIEPQARTSMSTPAHVYSVGRF